MLPTSYLTSTKNLEKIFNAIQDAEAPDQFTTAFLEQLGFKSSTDRLIIGVLKSLGFLDEAGKPTQNYFDFFDKSKSKQILASGIRKAYQDLFKINIKANELNSDTIKNKLKIISQGKLTPAVLTFMARTFLALVNLADFSSQAPKVEPLIDKDKVPVEEDNDKLIPPHEASKQVKLGGLVYNIQIVLPESRDPKVYDALFRSLREHLL